jgi:dihydrofolate reductase
MKLFILAAMTADGYVARDTQHLAHAWTTYEDKRLFTWLTKWAKVIIVGNQTYKTFERTFPDRRIIVMTRSPKDQTNNGPADHVEFTDEAPNKLLARLEAEGVTGVAICGGPQIYDLFKTTGLIHDFYITIQPGFFGTGLKLFTHELSMRLKLDEAQISTKDDTVILHYVDTASAD